MKNLGMGVCTLIGVPGIVFSIAYGMGCSNDSENLDEKGERVSGTQCPDDGNPCTVEDCSTGTLLTRMLTMEEEVDYVPPPPQCYKWVCRNGKPDPKEVALGAECALSLEKSGQCNASHLCVECTDSEHCSGETPLCYGETCVKCFSNGFDCGKNYMCGKCNSAACTVGNDGECASGKCVDGVCCENNCSGTCMACNVNGFEGKCSPAPANSTESGCMDSGACDGHGDCKRTVLADCEANDQCASGHCVGTCGNSGTCEAGGACNAEMNNICQTDLKCRYGTGVACNSHDKCASGICKPSSGTCT